jgi:hypothetical protein
MKLSIDRINPNHIIRFHTKPYKHQEETVRKTIDKQDHALFLDMGTGKSKILIDTIQNLYLNGNIEAAVIFAPKGVCNNWLSIELPKHLLEDEEIGYAGWVGGTLKQNGPAMKRLGAFKGLKIFVMNIEALSHTTGQKVALHFCSKFSNQGLLVAVDESTMIKNGRAKRTQFLMKLGDYARYKRIMSGNPVPRSPEDMFAQMYFLNTMAIGLRSLTAFRSEFCIQQQTYAAGRSFLSIIGYKNLDELRRRVKPWSTRILRSECLDLPDKVYQEVLVDLTDEQRKAYDDLVKKCVILLEDKLVTAKETITLMLRLQQIACGYIRADKGDYVSIKNNRVQALLDLLEGIEGKVIIWCSFVHSIRDIISALVKEYGPETVASFYGEVDTVSRNESTERFQNDPECRFLVANPAVGRFGLTLTAAHVAIYYNNSYNLEFREQSEDRIHRIGQTEKCLYIDITAKDTIDNYIKKKLRDKTLNSMAVNGDELLLELKGEMQ